jgi:Tol biopolymer transport system component
MGSLRAAAVLVALVAAGSAAGDAGRLTCPPRVPQDRHPVWAPTGDLIAFAREGDACRGTGESLFLVSRLGGMLRSLGAGESPSFSPDSSRVAYTARGRLYVAETRGRGLDELGPGSSPSWGPAGRVAFLDAGALWVVDPGTRERTRIRGGDLVGRSSWLRDGSGVVVARRVGGDDATRQLVRVELDGSLRELTEPHGSVADPEVTPDGRTVVFARRPVGGTWRIARVGVGGGDVEELTAGNVDQRFFDVSPDGDWLAYTGLKAADEAGLWLRRISGGGGGAELGVDGHPFSAPAWSADGRRIAFAQGRECLRWGIYVIDAVTRGDRRISNTCTRRGSGRVAGTPIRDVIRGSDRRDVVRALGGNDVVLSGGGPDVVDGGAGSDTLVTGLGDDRAIGGFGDDWIVPGRGRDRVAAGSGDDRIQAADAAADRIGCGSGRDDVTADREDRVARDCERVTRV